MCIFKNMINVQIYDDLRKTKDYIVFADISFFVCVLFIKLALSLGDKPIAQKWGLQYFRISSGERELIRRAMF